MKLKELRNQEKKTQQDIAKFLNTTQQTYARYEIETSEPTIETLCKLADYYNVSLDYLVGRNFNNEFGYLTDQEKSLLKMFRDMNEKNKIMYIGEALGLLAMQQNN